MRTGSRTTSNRPPGHTEDVSSCDFSRAATLAAEVERGVCEQREAELPRYPLDRLAGENEPAGVLPCIGSSRCFGSAVM
jgi:hypothetical protein